MTKVNTTKVTRLTGLNVRALREAVELGALPAATVITASTATFPGEPADALSTITAAREALAARFGRSQHPVASLNAVVRKVAAETGPTA